jgi:hypothetical protein
MEVEILSGMEGGEQVVVNPTDEVREGVHVKPVPFLIKNGAGASGRTPPIVNGPPRDAAPPK